MRLEELRVRGVVVRDGRGHLIEFTCKLMRPCRAVKAIGETGGGLSRTAKQEENGNGKLDREF